MICQSFCKETNISEKLCFVISTCCILISMHFFSTRPALLLYLFSGLFVIFMVVRVIAYWRENYLLFMLDMCYFINIISLVFVWGFPKSRVFQYIQFGLSNSHAYCGAFLFRNALVLHDFQKLVSAFIHVLPVLFSFFVRWFPEDTSVLWYTTFLNSGGYPNPRIWHSDANWFWIMFIPLILFISREILYYIIVYGCVKPSEKHLDSYRYLHKKKYITHLLWSRIDKRWHLPVWILLTILLSACILFLAILAWSSYLFHSAMIVVQLLTVTWNGACYYLDVRPSQSGRLQELLKVSTTGLHAPNPDKCETTNECNQTVLDSTPNLLANAENDEASAQSPLLPIYVPTDTVLEVHSFDSSTH